MPRKALAPVRAALWFAHEATGECEAAHRFAEERDEPGSSRNVKVMFGRDEGSVELQPCRHFTFCHFAAVDNERPVQSQFAPSTALSRCLREAAVRSGPRRRQRHSAVPVGDTDDC